MKTFLPLFFFILVSLKGNSQDSSAVQQNLMVDKLSNHLQLSNYTATIVPKDAWQFDFDLVYISNKYGEKDPTVFREASLPEVKVRYGLLKNLELRAGARLGYSYRKTRFNPAADRDPIFINPYAYYELFSDYFTLGTKINLQTYNRGAGLVSLLAETYLPIFRAKEVRGLYFSPTITLINANQLKNWLGYNLNLGIFFDYHSSKHSSPNFIKAYSLNISPTFIMSESFNSFIGVNLLSWPENSLSDFYAVYEMGLIYSPASPIQLRASLGTDKFSLTNRSFRSSLGLAWRPDF